MEDQQTISSFSAYLQTYWTYYLSLESRLSKTESYCAFSQKNSTAFSIEYLTLLLAVCGEIDSLAKAIGMYHFPETDLAKCQINKWGYYLNPAFPDLKDHVLEFKNGYQFRPFGGWQLTIKQNKRGQQIYLNTENSKNPTWWTDYNKVKHSRASIDSSRGLTNYEKANQVNVIESMGALFLLNRLMMKKLNEDAYQTIDRSKLFKLCNSMDETETSIHYGSRGVPLQTIRRGPHARI